MDNPEKLATLGTQDEDKQNKKQDTRRRQTKQNTQHKNMYSINVKNEIKLGNWLKRKLKNAE
jgi:hypothetical protein